MPGDEDPPSFADEVTLRDFQVPAAVFDAASPPPPEERSRVVARPEADGELDALDGVAVPWESSGWEDAEEEATVSLSDHQLSKLRAAAASDDAGVFMPRRPQPTPVDVRALPLPPVLDPEAGNEATSDAD